SLIRDFHYGADGTFLADVANGTYDVTVSLGDAMMKENNIDIYLEGTKVGAIADGNVGQFFNPIYRVKVTDGQLNLRLVDTGGSTPTGPPAAPDLSPVAPPSTGVAPTASIIGLPVSGHSPEGTTLTLQAGVTDPDSTSFTYSWLVTKNGAGFASSS